MEQEDFSVKKMWIDYLTSIGENIANTNKRYTSWHFCDNKESANNLAKLVISGSKSGTSSLYDIYKIENEELPKDDEYSVITDWNGIAQCVIRTKKVMILPFKDVTAESAKSEGEGDKSLSYWKSTHMEYFKKELMDYELEFDQNMLIVFEEFEVIYKN